MLLKYECIQIIITYIYIYTHIFTHNYIIRIYQYGYVYIYIYIEMNYCLGDVHLGTLHCKPWQQQFATFHSSVQKKDNNHLPTCFFLLFRCLSRFWFLKIRVLSTPKKIHWGRVIIKASIIFKASSPFDAEKHRDVCFDPKHGDPMGSDVHGIFTDIYRTFSNHFM